MGKILGRFSPEFLWAVVVAIVLGVFPMTWYFKGACLIVLVIFLFELVRRAPAPTWLRTIAALVTILAVAAVGIRLTSDQYATDSSLRELQAKRDLIAKYQAHDDSLKKVVAQYDRVTAAQSLFEGFRGKSDEKQHSEINARSVEDLKVLLNNFEAYAAPMGDGLRIKLGLNMYRIIFSVPMRIAPKITIGGLPPGTEAKIIEETNLGFTVLFLPLSRPIEHFGETADARLSGG